MRIQIAMVLGISFMVGNGTAIAAPACQARTPAQAIQMGSAAESRVSDADVSPVPSGGYRLRRIMADPALQRRWAFIDDCSHPERPSTIVALPAETVRMGAHPLDLAAIDVSRIEPAEPTRKSTAIPTAASFHRPSPILPRAQSTLQSSAPAGSSLIPAQPAPPSTTPLIRAGDRVHLWSSAANVRLEVEVIALEYGHAGQVIHLRRNGQQTLLAGVVVGKDSAELMQ